MSYPPNSRPTSLAAVEYSAPTMFHVSPRGVKREHLAKPDYWCHVSRMVKPGFKIEVLAEDGAFWALLLVGMVGKSELHVHELQFIELADVENAVTDNHDYEVKWGSPTVRWRVIRVSDGSVVKENIESKEAAMTWVRNREKMAA